MATELERKTTELQSELDELDLQHIREEFKIRLAHYNRCQPIYSSRDALLANNLTREDFSSFYSTAFSGFDVMDNLLPRTPKGVYDASFIRSFRAEYLPDEKMRVVLELYDNEYVKNEKLEKTVYLLDKDPEGTKVEWRDEPRRCVLFDFFASDADCLDLFDVLFEIYHNLITYRYERGDE